MYAKIIDEKTKECSVGLGTNAEFYRSIGMTEMDVEQAYNGNYYIKGYCPEKLREIKEQEIRQIRNEYLEDTDKFVSVSDFPVTEEEKNKYIEYRKYLRDYPESNEDWYKHNPKTFKEFKGENKWQI